MFFVGLHTKGTAFKRPFKLLQVPVSSSLMCACRTVPHVPTYKAKLCFQNHQAASEETPTPELPAQTLTVERTLPSTLLATPKKYLEETYRPEMNSVNSGLRKCFLRIVVQGTKLTQSQ